MMNKVEVCYSPALYKDYENPEAIVVVTDILRASSAIVTAFMNGVEKIIPVGTLEEAKDYKDRGYMVAAERDGIVRDFADFGNSPYNFTAERVQGKEIVYSGSLRLAYGRISFPVPCRLRRRLGQFF